MWTTITTGIAGGVIITVIAATGSFQGERKELTQREGTRVGSILFYPRERLKNAL